MLFLFFCLFLLLLLLLLIISPTKETFSVSASNDSVTKTTPVASDLDLITSAFTSAVNYNVTAFPNVNTFTKEPFYLPFPYSINSGLVSFILGRLKGVNVKTSLASLDLSTDDVRVSTDAYNIFKLKNTMASDTAIYYVFDVDIQDNTQFFTQTLRFFIRLDSPSSMEVLACLSETVSSTTASAFQPLPFNGVDPFTKF